MDCNEQTNGLSEFVTAKESTEMQLDKMLFSNNSGEVPIPRDEGFEEEMERLLKTAFETIQPEGSSDYDYGFNFENDTFFIFPYYWGDCNCDYDGKKDEWEANHTHNTSCPRAWYEAERDRMEGILPGWNGLQDHMNKWMEEKSLSNSCDCGYEKLREEWVTKNHHTDDCPLVRPNFYYKPDNIAIHMVQVSINGCLF